MSRNWAVIALAFIAGSKGISNERRSEGNEGATKREKTDRAQPGLLADM
jgi:hypothetical protein